MNTTAHSEVTQLLKSWRDGDQSALERLMPLVYDELHRLAHRTLGDERHVTLVQTTSLIHEAYLKIAGGMLPQWEGRSHLMAIFAHTMRQVLVDYARRRSAAKRGAHPHRIPLSDGLLFADGRSASLLDIDRALQELEATEPIRAQVIEMHYFGGLTLGECAAALGCAQKTVQRHLAAAELWMYGRLGPK